MFALIAVHLSVYLSMEVWITQCVYFNMQNLFYLPPVVFVKF